MPEPSGLPRRLRPTPERRTAVNLAAIQGLAQGNSKSLRPGQRLGLRVLQSLGIFAIALHGDDPNAPRPAVLLTYWVGAATPANGADYDFWYPATI